MIKAIIPLPNTREWCEHCHKKCDDVRRAYLITSTETLQEKPWVNKNMVLCSCCIDMALNEQQILPEEF